MPLFMICFAFFLNFYYFIHIYIILYITVTLSLNNKTLLIIFIIIAHVL